MHIPSMMLTRTVCLAAIALFFAVQMAGNVVACGSCLLHEAAVPVPPESSGVLAPPGILPIVLAGFIGIAVVFSVVYGMSRRTIAQKESGQ